jgi:hypothetical protein
MPFPAGWPPTPPSGVRSVRFFQAGTATADFADNAWLIGDTDAEAQVDPTPIVRPGGDIGTSEPRPTEIGRLARPAPPLGGGNVTPTGTPPQGAIVSRRAAGTFQISNDGATNNLEISFDGTTVHGVVFPEETRTYRQRYESGIAVRSAAGTDFRVEAW